MEKLLKYNTENEDLSRYPYNNVSIVVHFLFFLDFLLPIIQDKTRICVTYGKMTTGFYSRVWNRRRVGNKRRAWKIGQKE